MNMEIQGIQQHGADQNKAVEQPKKHEQVSTRATERQREITKQELENYLREISRYSDAFNRKLKFSVNHELEQVVVKVVDAETDKVIREVPPEALLRLHIRMKEAVGLLFDEEI